MNVENIDATETAKNKVCGQCYLKLEKNPVAWGVFPSGHILTRKEECLIQCHFKNACPGYFILNTKKVVRHVKRSSMIKTSNARSRRVTLSCDLFLEEKWIFRVELGKVEVQSRVFLRAEREREVAIKKQLAINS